MLIFFPLSPTIELYFLDTHHETQNQQYFLDAHRETQNQPFCGCHGNMVVAMETGPSRFFPRFFPNKGRWAHNNVKLLHCPFLCPKCSLAFCLFVCLGLWSYVNVEHHCNGTKLCCAPLTCIVHHHLHHRPALCRCTMETYFCGFIM